MGAGYVLKKIADNKIKVFIFCVIVAICSALYLGFFTVSPIFAYNYSASLPKGWYLIVKQEKERYKIGDIVAFEVPKDMESYTYGRHWMRPGELLLKEIGALEGTRYAISPQGFLIEDRYVGPVFATDSRNLEMPKRYGKFSVKENCFLPISKKYSNSFDGRYFGDIPLEAIHFKAVPLFIEWWE